MPHLRKKPNKAKQTVREADSDSREYLQTKYNTCQFTLPNLSQIGIYLYPQCNEFALLRARQKQFEEGGEAGRMLARHIHKTEGHHEYHASD